MGIDGDDKDRIMRHFNRESSARQAELASDFDSFVDWMSAIGNLIKLIEYAARLWKWIRAKW